MDRGKFRRGGPGVYLEEMNWSISRRDGHGVYLEWLGQDYI